VIFLDALVLKIRDGGSVQRKACYLALGVSIDGGRDVLGMAHQRSPARLARIRPQLSIQRPELRVERVDHRKRQRDLLARTGRQRLAGKPALPLARHQVASLQAAVVPGCAAATRRAAQTACAAA
jgi:hypothetical protein